MRAPVWVVKMWSGGSVSVDLYMGATRDGGMRWSHSRDEACRFMARGDARLVAGGIEGSRVVRLVPRKRGGR